MKNNISNADRISQNIITGINQLVELEIVIDGKTINSFKHFNLKQSAKKHHHFELTLAHDSLSKIQNHTLEFQENA